MNNLRRLYPTINFNKELSIIKYQEETKTNQNKVILK